MGTTSQIFCLLFVLLLKETITENDGNVSDAEGGGDKRCWMTSTITPQKQQALLSEDTLKDLRRIKKKIEQELEPMGIYGKVAEIEFEFENDREIALHVVSSESSIEFVCSSFE